MNSKSCSHVWPTRSALVVRISVIPWKRPRNSIFEDDLIQMNDVGSRTKPVVMKFFELLGFSLL